MPFQTTLFTGYIYFKFKSTGWSETHNLKTTDVNAALTEMTLACHLRRSFMGYGVEICYAKVSNNDAARDACLVELDYPFIAHKEIALAGINGDDSARPEDPWTALHFRMEGPGCKPAQRFIRGVPDKLINVLVAKPDEAQLAPMPVGSSLEIDGRWNLVRTRRAYLQWLRDRTAYAKKTNQGGQDGWDVLDWQRIIYRRVGNRKVGRPFGLFRGRSPNRVQEAGA